MQSQKVISKAKELARCCCRNWSQTEICWDVFFCSSFRIFVSKKTSQDVFQPSHLVNQVSLRGIQRPRGQPPDLRSKTKNAPFCPKFVQVCRVDRAGHHCHWHTAFPSNLRLSSQRLKRMRANFRWKCRTNNFSDALSARFHACKYAGYHVSAGTCNCRQKKAEELRQQKRTGSQFNWRSLPSSDATKWLLEDFHNGHSRGIRFICAIFLWQRKIWLSRHENSCTDWPSIFSHSFWHLFC